jgi:hypothetical protein
VGARIWDLCDGSLTIEEIAARLAAEYDAPEDEIVADVRELVRELAAEGLLDGD